MYNPEELFLKGKALGAERDYRGAESLYRQIIAMGQNDPKVFLQLGCVLHLQGRNQEAIDVEARALELDQQLIWAHNWRGMAFAALGRYQESIQQFDRTIEIARNQDNKFQLAAGCKYKTQSLMRLKRYGEALETNQYAIQNNPSVTYFLDRADIYETIKELQGAIATYTIVVERWPEDYFGYFKRGELRKQCKDEKGALKDFIKAARLAKDGKQGLVPLTKHVSGFLQNYQNTIGGLNQEMQALTNELISRGQVQIEVANDFQDEVSNKLIVLAQIPRLNQSEKKVLMILSLNEEIFLIKSEQRRQQTAHNREFMGYDQAFNSRLSKMQQQLMLNAEYIKKLHEADAVNQSKILQLQRLSQANYDNLNQFKNNFSSQFLKIQKSQRQFEDMLATLGKDKNLVRDYVDGFLRQCNATYSSSMLISKGVFKMQNQTALFTIGTNLLSFIPFVGDALSKGFQFLYQYYNDTKKQQQAQNILRYCSTDTDFIDNMRYVAINCMLRVNKRKSVIRKAEAETQSFIQRLFSFGQSLKKKIDNLIEFNMADLFDSDQYALGMKDADLILEKYLLNGQILKYKEREMDLDFLIDTLSDVPEIHDDFEKTIPFQSLETSRGIQQPLQAQRWGSNTEQQKSLCQRCCPCCSIYRCEIVYSNPLLNNRHLLSLSIKVLGLQRVLKLSVQLSSELIEQALQKCDGELILAGLLSQCE